MDTYNGVIERTTRPLTEKEQRRRYRDIPLFSFQQRALARAEARHNKVEVLTFKIQRVWNLLICDGPPCCPNSWLLQADEDTYMFVSTWKFLRAEDRMFPGSEVKIERLPFTKRLVGASASGEHMKAGLITGGSHTALVTQFEFEADIIERDELPKAVLQVVDKGDK